MPGTEMHAHLFEVRTCTHVRRLKKLWVFMTRDNASLARLTRKMVPITRRASSCLDLALSILLSSVAHCPSSLSCRFFFFSGFLSSVAH